MKKQMINLVVLITLIMTTGISAAVTCTVYDSTNTSLPGTDLEPMFTKIDSEGHFWLAHMSGMIVFDTPEMKNEIANFNHEDIGIEDIYIWPNNFVERDGKKYFSTEGAGIVVYDGSDWQIINSDNSALLSNACFDITIDDNDKIWIANSKGIFTIDTADNWQVFDNTNTPMDDLPMITDFKFDENGTLWLCGYSGVISYDANEWILKIPTEYDDSVRTIEIKEGLIYCGSAAGFYTYNIETEEVIDLSSNLSYEKIIKCRKNPISEEIWVLQNKDWFTFGALAKQDENNWFEFINTDLGQNEEIGTIFSITFDDSGNAWLPVKELGFIKVQFTTFESPCNLVADYTAGNDFVNLFWTAPNARTEKNEMRYIDSASDSGSSCDQKFRHYLSKELSGYNIYKNDVLIKTTTSNDYTVPDLNEGEYSFAVSAVYSDGESSRAYFGTITVSQDGEVWLNYGITFNGNSLTYDGHSAYDIAMDFNIADIPGGITDIMQIKAAGAADYTNAWKIVEYNGSVSNNIIDNLEGTVETLGKDGNDIFIESITDVNMPCNIYFLSKFLQLYLPEPITMAVAAATICVY